VDDPAAMSARRVPARDRRNYGNDPQPTAEEALDEPLAAFQSWFLRSAITAACVTMDAADGRERPR
jgi:hypothetical protein